MANIFEATYEKVQELKKAFDIATDEVSRDEIRGAYAATMQGLDSLGTEERIIWRAYEESRDCGNEYLDLHDCIQEDRVSGLIKALRENGISKFTFSSNWSSAVETAWLFTKEGCSLEGIIEINSTHKKFMSDEYEKAHGYLFKVN